MEDVIREHHPTRQDAGRVFGHAYECPVSTEETVEFFSLKVLYGHRFLAATIDLWLSKNEAVCSPVDRDECLIDQDPTAMLLCQEVYLRCDRFSLSSKAGRFHEGILR